MCIRYSTSLIKEELLMEQKYEMENFEEELTHDDAWADSIISILVTFLTIVGIPYTIYILVKFLLSF